ncbi:MULTISPECIES: hypothetical protein [Cysteiniphilum]|uniref:Transposase n=1 Tax=Cysteiniphilum litorale TaxID=2056700 RepID=A0A8J3E9A7_9GAMM|nr:MULTISPECIES: hypothetical protein [Cysteiniphilum]MDA0911413.1 hypothetical protein [Pseudomonadota bacterium]WHN66275.1 hypothetical protein NYP54_03325 [Cysteiniphilum sp. QT6929]GGG00039.1 hypothetical protein GCM10010995_16710 [Cysteiniphilum litorale]
MANQYTGSFEHIIQQKYNCSAREVLERCADEGMTYQDAEKMLGFKHGTIRKWANRFDIKLKSGIVEKTVKRDSFMKMFKQKGLNKYNVLSRCWGVKKRKLAFISTNG